MVVYWCYVRLMSSCSIVVDMMFILCACVCAGQTPLNGA